MKDLCGKKKKKTFIANVFQVLGTEPNKRIGTSSSRSSNQFFTTGGYTEGRTLVDTVCTLTYTDHIVVRYTQGLPVLRV